MEHTNLFVTNIEKETLDNNFYRKVLFTTDHQQLVLMNIKPNEDIEFEHHPNNDQFIRIEKGSGYLLIGPKKEFKYQLSDGISATIPAGTWHQVINTSNTEPLKLYTIYSPPNHPRGLVQADRPKSCEKKNQDGGYKKSYRKLY